ncbi:serine protease, partial [Streptomyces diastatochromogenes]
MTHTPERDPIPGHRRLARIGLAVGVVAALCATGPIPLALAADAPPAAATDPGVKSAHDKLGSDDADLLAEAKADGDKNVTMMIATAPGKTEQVTEELDAVKGGSVGRTYDKLGYVRATVPTAKADSAIAAAAKLSSVHAIDLRQEIALDDPAPNGDTAKSATATKTYPGPGKDTPAENPYNPSFETGAGGGGGEPPPRARARGPRRTPR